MENILNLAGNVCWGLSTRNNELFLNAANQLYNYVQANGAYLLTDIEETSNLQMVGKAFSYFARFIDNGDPDINSVAAENAYFCLGKSILKDNYFAAPELYNLLDSSSELLMDKFIPVRMAEIVKFTRMPIEMLYGNPHESEEAKEEARKYIPHVKFYVISKFYDIKLNKSLMPEDIIEYSNLKVISHIKKMLESSTYESAITMGKDYFEKVYQETEMTLLNF